MVEQSGAGLLESLPNSALSSSSSAAWDRLSSHYSRLHTESDSEYYCAWCPLSDSTSEWIQVDLGEIRILTTIATQGRYYSPDFNYDSERYVETYKLSYSQAPSLDFNFVLDFHNNQKIFGGNSDANTVVSHCLGHLQARIVKLHPESFANQMCLRWELYAETEGIKKYLRPQSFQSFF